MPHSLRVRTVGVALLLVVSAAPLLAQPAPEPRLVVGVKEAPPFVIRSQDGGWTGISIELWEHVADQAGFTFDYRETDLPGLLAGVESGAFDVGVAAITLTPDREAVMDFSHPFHVSGLGIAARTTDRRRWLTVVEQLFSRDFLAVVLGLTALLFVVGWLVWLFEHRRNAEQFGGTTVDGLGSSFWWSAVTMTTVGYGDKSPSTLGGRIVALVWMFAGLVVISTFTASITAALTVGSLESGVTGPRDLPNVRIGSVTASTSTEYLDREGLSFLSVETPDAALAALEAESVDAVVYDAPILRFLVRRQYGGRLTVLSASVAQQRYAFALPAGSALREPINVAMLGRILAPDWPRLLDSYLGETP